MTRKVLIVGASKRASQEIVLRANAFSVAMRLRAIGRKAEILDSHRAGKVGKVYCANDRVDAVKIARIYLSARFPLLCGNRMRRPWSGARSNTVRYDAVNAMLLNEFLKEHREVAELKSTVAEQRKGMEAMAAQPQMSRPRNSRR